MVTEAVRMEHEFWRLLHAHVHLHVSHRWRIAGVSPHLMEARLRALESMRIEGLLQVVRIHVLELAVVGQTMRHLL